MRLLRLILLVMLGLLTPSMAAVSSQIDGGLGTGNINEDLDRTPGNELADRASLDSILQKYELTCAYTGRLGTSIPTAPGSAKGLILTDRFCHKWIECGPDGKKKQYKFQRAKNKYWADKEAAIRWCFDNCQCQVIDQPVQHPAANLGCVDPYGALIQGMYGSVARDVDSAPPPPGGKDGLVMEPFDGPARKE